MFWNKRIRVYLSRRHIVANARNVNVVPVARYFLYVGSVLVALLFVANWMWPSSAPVQAQDGAAEGPIARIHSMTVTAGDPVIMLEEPIPATRRALDRAGLKIGDIDLFEVNEAFASIPLAWLQALGADPERLNVNGGAIALGHPLGASGTKLMATLIHELRARGKRFGLQTMCEGGGTANVTIIEAL